MIRSSRWKSWPHSDPKAGSGKRSATEIVAQTIQFLGGRPGAMEESGPSGAMDLPPPMDDEDIPF